MREDGTPALESRVAPGLPLQVTCFERADDIGDRRLGRRHPRAGDPRVVPDLDRRRFPLARPGAARAVVYLLDPIGASRRSATLRVADSRHRGSCAAFCRTSVTRCTPAVAAGVPAARSPAASILSLGQFMQWVGGQVMGSGLD